MIHMQKIVFFCVSNAPPRVFFCLIWWSKTLLKKPELNGGNYLANLIPWIARVLIGFLWLLSYRFEGFEWQEGEKLGTEMDRRREKLLGSNGTNSRFSSSRQFDTILGLVSWGQLNSKTLLGRAREKIRFSELSATDSKGERVHQKLVKCKSCCY